jgi:hypothetical protein
MAASPSRCRSGSRTSANGCGEAIYGTRTFRDGAQWTEGRRQEVDTSTNYRAKYDVEALTLHPAPGDARKEILFTRKGAALYAILPLMPRGPLVLHDVKVREDTRVTLLVGNSPALPWHALGNDTVITLPPIRDGSLPFTGPLAVKIDGLVD